MQKFRTCVLQDLGKEIDSMRKKEDVHTMLRKVIERALQIQKCHTHETRLKVSLDRRVLEWDKNQIVSEPIIASVSANAGTASQFQTVSELHHLIDRILGTS